MTRRVEHVLIIDGASRRRRPGVTLLELLVALALLGLVAAIAVVSLPRAAAPKDPATDRARRIAARLATARHEAIRSGRAVTIYIADGRADAERGTDSSQAAFAATAQPDGSLVVDAAISAALAVSRLDGDVRVEAGHAR
jgi:type II secretion system protein H